MSWSDELARATEEFKSIVCMGMDPVKEKISTILHDGDESKFNPKEDIIYFYDSIIQKLVEEDTIPGAVKPNYAFYADHGFPGLEALVEVIGIAKDNRIPVILDAKRADIGKTSKAYTGEVFKSEWAGDAVTVAPYMGGDSVGPFVEKAVSDGKGVYILARTSNKGGADLQNLVLKDGRTLYQATLDKIFEWGKDAKNNVGFVAGGTTPDELNDILHRVGEYNPAIPGLIPGVGAQGGDEGIVTRYMVKNKIDLKRQRINSSGGLNYAALKDKTITNLATQFAQSTVNKLAQMNNKIYDAGLKV